MVKENLQKVEDNITAACERAGRKRENVTLIAVSKTKPMEMIVEAYEAGKRDFGENKAQEMKEKHDALADDIKWHFIGHLQTNKVKYVVGRAALIHSVDSLHLAEAIEKESAKKNLISDILIEVNVAHEESKFGLKTEEVPLQKKTAAGTRALKLEEGEEVVFADSFDAKEKVFAEVQGRKIELSKLTKKKRDAKPEQVK